MNNKYGFRLYKLDNNGNLLSPYVEGDNATTHKLNNTYKGDNKVSDSLSYFLRDIDSDKVKEVHNDHIGYSLLGLPGKATSFYELHDLFNPAYGVYNKAAEYFINNADPAALEHLHNDMGRELSAQDLVDHFYRNKHITNTREGTNALLDVIQGKVRPKSRYATPMFMASKHDGKEVSDDVKVRRLLSVLAEYADDNDNASQIALVKVPMDKLVTVDDVVNNDLSPQRDLPEELVAREITPTQLFDGMKYSSAIKNAITNGVNPMDILNDTFKLSKDDIAVSDETKKSIIQDMSNDYNTLLKQRNINDTLIDCSRY